MEDDRNEDEDDVGALLCAVLGHFSNSAAAVDRNQKIYVHVIEIYFDEAMDVPVL